MYYEQITAAAYASLLADFLADYDHTYRPDTEQLVVWTNVHQNWMADAIKLAAGLNDTGHTHSTVTGLLADQNGERPLTAGEQESLTQVFEAITGKPREAILSDLEAVCDAAQAVQSVLGDLPDDLVLPGAAPTKGTRDERADAYSALLELLSTQGEGAARQYLYGISREAVQFCSYWTAAEVRKFPKHTELCDAVVAKLGKTIKQGHAFLNYNK